SLFAAWRTVKILVGLRSKSSVRWVFGDRKGAGPAAVGFDHLVDLGHQADRLFQGDHDALVVQDVLVAEDPAAAVLQPLLANLIPTDMKVPNIFRHALEPARRADVDDSSYCSGGL